MEHHHHAEEAESVHSEKYKEMVRRPDRYGMLQNHHGRGERTGDCGDTIEMFLTVREGMISMVTFIVQGCANTVACGNTVTVLMEGRSLSDAWQISPEHVANYLETLPPDHFHCAELAVGAFYNALADYERRQKEQWKQAYNRAG